jgi:hypothetical protein
MKKIPFLFLLFLFFFQPLYAQFGIGVLGGVNLASSSFPDIGGGEPSAMPYFHFGAHAEYQLNEKLGIQGDILFSQKGFQFKSSGSGNDSKFRYGYVVLAPEIFVQPISNLAIGAGFHLGFNLSEQQNLGDGWIDTSPIETIKKTDFGINGSARISFGPLYLQARYLYGLADISNTVFTDVSGNPLPDPQQNNRTFQLSIGYMLDRDE